MDFYIRPHGCRRAHGEKDAEAHAQEHDETPKKKKRRVIENSSVSA